ncbi:MAG: dUTP diphosphatase [Lachnospiraceae bacterium]|nr:dUTP diphosphatase [Lachnospiraceae bacterium]
MKVRIKKLSEKAIIPTYGTDYAAGADLYACLENTVSVENGKTEMIGTGVALEIPEGYVGLVYARSGLSCKKGLAPANKVGVIDSDYRGEIKVALHNHNISGDAIPVENGERIAQIVIAPYIKADFELTENLDETDRGEKGFGSTGTR